MEKVLYYARICYLDAALEHIRSISIQYDVYVLIGISPRELSENLFNIQTDLRGYPIINSFEEIVKDWGLEYIREYIDKCKGVHFAVYEEDDSWSTLIATTSKVVNHLKSIQPDILHFDDFSMRQSLLLPYIIFNRNKVVLNVHDPKPHSGERLLYSLLLKFLLYKLVNKFVVFSEYSKGELAKQVGMDKKITALKLLPYKVYLNQKPTSVNNNLLLHKDSYISFIGRLSKYKGIEIFIEAASHVNKYFPEQKFVIAGKPVFKYSLPTMELGGNIEVIRRYVSNQEIAQILSQSMLIVCPYLDATQSGVVMTAQAFGVPVIVSNSGGLPEYIVDGCNGIILKQNNPEELSRELMNILENQSSTIFWGQQEQDRRGEIDRMTNLQKIEVLYNKAKK